MKGKSISIPFGMVFKKYYCSKCGTRLKKEKTHRIVTPSDKDYYRYHEHGTFPRCNYDVYDYQFQCPACKARISYDEQCKIELIQKQQGETVLSSAQIKDNYENSSKENYKRSLTRTILRRIIFALLSFTLIYFFVTDRTLPHLAMIAISFVIFTGCSVWMDIRKFKGTSKLRGYRFYSYEKESRMHKLYAYASHNKHMVEKSDKCYCFHCKSMFESSEVDSYLENEQTALCPKCNIDSVIPDSVDDTVDESVIAEMHDYWF